MAFGIVKAVVEMREERPANLVVVQQTFLQRSRADACSAFQPLIFDGMPSMTPADFDSQSG